MYSNRTQVWLSLILLGIGLSFGLGGFFFYQISQWQKEASLVGEKASLEKRNAELFTQMEGLLLKSAPEVAKIRSYFVYNQTEAILAFLLSLEEVAGKAGVKLSFSNTSVDESAGPIKNSGGNKEDDDSKGGTAAGSTPKTKSTSPKLLVSMNLSGDFSALTKFISLVEVMPFSVKILSLEMVTKDVEAKTSAISTKNFKKPVKSEQIWEGTMTVSLNSFLSMKDLTNKETGEDLSATTGINQ